MDDEDMSCTSGDDYGGYGDEDYYNEADVDAADDVEVTPTHSEEAEYECLTVSQVNRLILINHEQSPKKSDFQVERVFLDGMNQLTARIPVNDKCARTLLEANQWDVERVVKLYRQDRTDLFRRSHIDARPEPKRKLSATSGVKAKGYCTVCAMEGHAELPHLACGHCFCEHCWKSHVESSVRCGADYHAPTSCDTIRQWMTKCADDSETANYISAHTKDCPQCHSCIEKAGGCNHIQCTRCRHHFCWMCFGDWKSHGSEYYECSRYKENPSVAAEANHVKARRALEKYLHYFERFENHSKSLKMEEELRDKIRKKIDDKVNEHNGTWIDWQYLHKSVSLLTKCRYTLQYTYPFAYYLTGSPRKNLFEYQQAQLEKEVEELAWAVERADGTARGALEAHMHRAEHKRQTLLHDFFF
ncbi:Protein CBG19920 [Caenorhabditis briggsae]|uniref:RBR-type E3 ubiquitin transferase n=1 Tax=Caenorhabditis briggsae TaxID=6238 RepID=A8XWR0_CAEBR|nr:Protein CBG19920 [Caenorhabditis briggsae]CAP37079.2 Protein CBG19920 [Caenorhabditis briggsae]